MACKIERVQTVPVFDHDPTTYGVVVTGWKKYRSPCGRKSERGQPCKSCQKGREGDHDRMTRKGRKELAKWQGK